MRCGSGADQGFVGAFRAEEVHGIAQEAAGFQRERAGGGGGGRWDTERAQACTLYTDGQELRLYYPDEKREEIYPVDARWGDLLTSPVPRLSAIKKHFTIERATQDELSGALRSAAAANGSLALRLTPHDAELAQHVREVVVVLDEAAGLTRAVETTDPDGDRTEIVFSAVHINTGLVPGDLELQVPADTAVSRPLEGAPTTNSSSSP